MKKITILVPGFFLCICLYAQNIGSKVSFVAVDGKTYTGSVSDIKDGKYKIKYDGVDFDAWMNSNQFTVTGGANNAQAPQQNKTGTLTNGQAGWKVGDKVQVRTSSMDKWENATIFLVLTDRTPVMYKANLDDPGNYATTDPLLTGGQVRARGLTAATNFTLNMQVDVSYAGGGPRGRGLIVQVLPGGRYKVGYDGCKSYFDEVVDWSQLQTAAVVAANHPDITSVFGKWAMFTPSYPNTVVHGNNVYREYGTGAKAPPLQVNSDGTFTWYFDFGKPPVKGTWGTHAKIEGLTIGTESVNGIIIYDPEHIYYKVYRDRQDHIEVRKMCSGETMMGSKIQ